MAISEGGKGRMVQGKFTESSSEKVVQKGGRVRARDLQTLNNKPREKESTLSNFVPREGGKEVRSGLPLSKPYNNNLLWGIFEGFLGKASGGRFWGE